MIRLFVYGTLMRGQHNHRVLAGARFVGPALTRDAFTLLDLGGCPALVTGPVSRIVGEVFEVDEVTLARCDRLEGHPTLYRREPVTLDDGSKASTYRYVQGSRRAPVILSGSWLDADRFGLVDESDGDS